MRKVNFKKWHPAKFETSNGMSKLIAPAVLDADFCNRGYFHGFTTEGCDDNISVVCIVETEEGLIEVMHYSHVKFTSL